MGLSTRLTSSGTYYINGEFDEVTFSIASNQVITDANLLAYSDFQGSGGTQASGYWFFPAGGPASLSTPPATVLAPDESVNAKKIVDTSLTSEHYIEQQITISTTTTATYTYSVFCKAAERTYAYLRVVNNGGLYDSSVLYNLSTGVPGAPSGIISSVFQTPVGATGWYRCGFTYVMPNSVTMLHRVQVVSAAGAGSYAGDGISGYYIWGAQLVPGNTATMYMPTGARVGGSATGNRFLGNVPFKSRITDTGTVYLTTGEFDEVTYNPLSGQVRNLLASSQNFLNASVWTTQTASAFLTPNVAPAPDNTLSAFRLQDSLDAVANTHDVQYSITLTAGRTYSFSMFAKAGTLHGVTMAANPAYFADAVERRVNFFSSSTTYSVATAGTLTNVGIVHVGNGWNRCTMAFTATVSATSTIGFRPNNGSTGFYQGNGTGNVLVWGAQLEYASTATDYVATTATGALINYGVSKQDSDGILYVRDQFDEVIKPIDFTTGIVYFNDLALPQSYTGTGALIWSIIPGGSNRLSITNTATVTTNYGGSLLFSGPASYAGGGSLTLSTTTAITAAVWVNQFSTIRTNQRWMTLGSEYFVMRGWSSGYQIYATINGTIQQIITGSVLLNTPFFLAATFDGTNLTVYRNGVQLASSAFPGVLSATTLSVGIGNGTGDGLDGEVYQQIVWNRVLSAGELLNYYNQTKVRFDLL